MVGEVDAASGEATRLHCLEQKRGSLKEFSS